MGRPPPLIRDFELRDQAQVQRLILDGMQDRWGEDFDPEQNQDTSDMWTNYMSNGAQVVVLEAGTKISATGTMLVEESSTVRLARMATDRAYRGEGHGSAIVRELLGRAIEMGARRAVVTTDTPWVDAVAFYERCGFKVVDVDGDSTHLSRPLSLLEPVHENSGGV